MQTVLSSYSPSNSQNDQALRYYNHLNYYFHSDSMAVAIKSSDGRLRCSDRRIAPPPPPPLSAVPLHPPAAALQSTSSCNSPAYLSTDFQNRTPADSRASTPNGLQRNNWAVVTGLRCKARSYRRRTRRGLIAVAHGMHGVCSQRQRDTKQRQPRRPRRSALPPSSQAYKRAAAHAPG